MRLQGITTILDALRPSLSDHDEAESLSLQEENLLIAVSISNAIGQLAAFFLNGE
jgi:hypothetical protein